MKRLKSALSMFMAALLVVTMLPADQSYGHELVEGPEITVTKGEDENSNIITIDRDGLSVSSFCEMYSEEAPERSTWYTFYSVGSLRKDVNGASGYHILYFGSSDTVEYTCNAEGYYNFYINNTLYTVYVGEEDIPESSGETPTPVTPAANVTYDVSGNIITIDKNGTNATGVSVMLSSTAPTTTSWYSFVVAGKNNTAFNGPNGYLTMAFNSVSNKAIYECKVPGTYYFYACNQEASFTIEEGDIPTPSSGSTPPATNVSYDVSGNVVTISKNGTSATGVNVMLSSTPPTTSSWYSFVTAGKTNTAFNGANGYGTISFNPSTNTAKYACKQAGTYYFYACNQIYSVIIGEEAITEATVVDPIGAPGVIYDVSGNVVCIDKNGTGITGVNVMKSSTSPVTASWYSFVTAGLTNTAFNGPSGYKIITFPYGSEGTSYVCTQAGTYYFYANNQLHTEFIDAADIPEDGGMPLGNPNVSYDVSGNVITIDKNGTSSTGVNVMHSSTAPTTTSWYSFVTAGKTNTSFNGVNGYRLLPFNNVTNQTVYIAPEAGTYYFYACNQLETIEIGEEDIPEPAEVIPPAEVEFSKSGNVITMDKNGTSATSVCVILSDSAPATESWYSYCQAGKTNTAFNGETGYKYVYFSGDTATYRCKVPGTYYFRALEKVYSFTVTLEEIPEEERMPVPEPEPDVSVSMNDCTITITKNGANVAAAYVMYSDEAPANESWTSYVLKGKEHTAVNSYDGYRTISLPAESTDYTCEYAGVYNIWVQNKLFSFEVTTEDFAENEMEPEEVPEDVPMPDAIVSISGNEITIDKNGLVAASALVMYSPTPAASNTWYSFVTTGQANSAYNGTTGYKAIMLPLEQTKQKVFDTGYYYYWINNKMYHAQLTAENTPESRYAEVSVANNQLSIAENGAHISSIRYTYTPSEPTFTDGFNEEELYEQGKLYPENSKDGYVTVVAPYDLKAITARKAGVYTFVITDDSGVHTMPIVVDEEVVVEANEASADVSGNVITIHDNDSNLTSVLYMYSSDYYFFTNTSEFAAKGRTDTANNSSAGYRGVSMITPAAEGGETPVPTYDGATITAELGGYYVIQFTDDSGVHGKTIKIEQETVDATRPTAEVIGHQIKVSTEDTEGYTLKSVHYINTAERFDYSSWYWFVTIGKLKKDINGDNGYLTATADAEGTAYVTCRAPGYYTLLMNYVKDDDPTKTLTFPTVVEVQDYQAEVRLTLDGETSEAGNLLPGRSVTDADKAATSLYLKDTDDNYTKLSSNFKGVYYGVVSGNDTYDICFGKEDEEKTDLGIVVDDNNPKKILKLYTAKVTLTDLEGTYNPYAVEGETFTIDMSADTENRKELPRNVTVREEGEATDYTYNNRTGHIEIPDVQGRITVKAMAIRGHNHIDIKLNSMGGNIYDAAWTDAGNFQYSAENLSGENILLPTPLTPANSETIKFDGWYKDLGYTQKVTSLNSDDYSAETATEVARRDVTKYVDGVETQVPTDFPVIRLYAKWVFTANTYTDKMYYEMRGNGFEVRGRDGSTNIKTTYNNNGYYNYYYYNNGTAYSVAPNGSSSYSGTSMTFNSGANNNIFKEFQSGVYVAQVMASQGSYVTVNYIMVNTNSSTFNNISFGAAADVQIASNDSAKITAGTDANGTYLLMEDGSKYAFRLYTMDADRYWIGGYASSKNLNNKGYQSNVFNDSSSNTNHYDKKFSSGDSALAFSFINQCIPANSTLIRTVKFGVGTMSEMGSKSGANITLVGCGGTWDGNPMKFLTSSAATMSLTGNQPVRDGYSFVEWNTRSDGNGTSYTSDSKIGTATLYAIWDEVVPPSYNVYNKSEVRSENNYLLPKEKAEITLFYGENLIDQDDFEVDAASASSDFNCTLKLNADKAGYCLGDTITVLVGTTELVPGTDYIYTHASNSDTAELTIKAQKITGNITVKAIGMLKPVKIPVLTISPAVYDVSLNDMLQIEMEVTNKDTDNQSYYYKWYKNTTGIATGGTELPYTTETLPISQFTTAAAGTVYFYCVVTTVRKDNLQSAKVLSDVVQLNIHKAPLNSYIIVSQDDDMNDVYRLSSNPGNGAVTYTYYRDADCTVKTDATDGAGVNGGKPTRNDSYYVKAHINETANYLACETPAVVYRVADTPSFTQDGKVITLYNNDSALKSFMVMYSEDWYDYTTWYGYVTLGKEHPEINTAYGYLSRTGQVDEHNGSTLDGAVFVAPKAGYYNLLFSYDNGKIMSACVLVSETDLVQGVPYVEQREVAGNEITFVNNNNNDLSSLKAVKYIYTGNTEFNPTTWLAFVNKGLEKSKINSAQGYRLVKATKYRALALVDGTEDVYESVPATESTEGAVISLDGDSVILPRAGYYTFWLTYAEADSSIHERNETVYVGESKTGVDNTGFNINYYDSLPDGNIYSIRYMNVGDEEPDISDYDTDSTLFGFSDGTAVTSYQNVDGNVVSVQVDRSQYYSSHPSETRLEIPFSVSQYGWYVIRVVYYVNSVPFTNYYKVYVGDERSDENKIVLVIDGGLIQAFDGSDSNNIITKIKFVDDANFKAGNAIIAYTTGIHTLTCVDSYGYTYNPQANVLTLERAISTASLESLIATAKAQRDAVRYEDYDGYMVKAGAYSTTEAKTTLNAAIDAAQDIVDMPLNQTQVDSGYYSLAAALQNFRYTITVIDADLVTVTDDTINIHPSNDGYTLDYVIYSINNQTQKYLEPLVFSSWAGIAQKPYARKTTFNLDGEVTFVEADNGIYTFLISQNEGGIKQEYVRYAVVHVGETEKETATSELDRYITMANELKATAKRGQSAAGPGETYVPEAYYDRLVEEIALSDAMYSTLTEDSENTLDTYDDIIPRIRSLHSAILTFGSKRVTKPLEESTPLVIDSTDHTNVTLTKSDIVSASIVYGYHTAWVSFGLQNYRTYYAHDGVVVYPDAEYNGVYTAFCNYSDGGNSYEHFEIDDIIYPFTVTQENGEITLDLEETDAVLIGYQYGDKVKSADDVFFEIEQEEDQTVYTVPAFGDGVHTVLVKTADHTYYQKITVDSCGGPVIVEYAGKIAAFTHGYSDYDCVAYVPYEGATGYRSWLDMYSDATYLSPNTWYPPSAFTDGDNYTFYFKSTYNASAPSVFKDYTINR